MHETAAHATGWLFDFLPLLVLGIPFAIGNAALARRLGRSRAAWVALSLIPLVNYVFFLYVGYQVVFAVLDRLPARAGGTPPT